MFNLKGNGHQRRREEEYQRRRDEELRQRDEEQRLRDEEQRREFQQRDEEQRREFQQMMIAAMSEMNNNRSEGNDSSTSNNNTTSNKNPRAPRPSTIDVDITYSKFRSWRNAWDDYVMLQQLDSKY